MEDNMEITTNTSIIITINGQQFSFDNPHPIMDLIDQVNNEKVSLELWQQRTIDSQVKIDNLNAQITALCQ